jgi:hypothetical protein
MTGMLGVYLVAAELTRRGFIVSTTSRSAAGADLLVTDQSCLKAWSVQVKTNKSPINYWLLSSHTKTQVSKTHIYVFVNINGDKLPDYFVVPSKQVADNMESEKSPKGWDWYWFSLANALFAREGWDSVFGDPHVTTDLEDIASETIP